jgi:hypothetical protein
VTQGVALGWHVTGPLALDTSASQPFFGYQPVFNLSWYHTVVWPCGAAFDPATLHDWPEHEAAFRAAAERWKHSAASV